MFKKIIKTVKSTAILVSVAGLALTSLAAPSINAAPSQSTCNTLTSQSYYIGQQGSSIVDLQDCLTASGHFTFSGGSTGYYGTITQTALNAYLGVSTGTPTFAWPTDSRNISCGYYCYSSHPAIDIQSPSVAHPPVYASSSGTVIEILSSCPSRDYSYDCYGAPKGYFGNYVIIDHGSGYTTLYAHLKNTSVSLGQQVSKGQTIGYMGNSGNTHGLTGIHLHFELLLNGVHQNPISYI